MERNVYFNTNNLCDSRMKRRWQKQFLRLQKELCDYTYNCRKHFHYPKTMWGSGVHKLSFFGPCMYSQWMNPKVLDIGSMHHMTLTIYFPAHADISRAHSFQRLNLTNSAVNLVNSTAHRGKADEIPRLTADTQLNFRGLIKSWINRSNSSKHPPADATILNINRINYLKSHS